MSIATIKAAIGGQIYNLTLAEDGYYTLSGTAPALSSANLPGGYYGVQIIATDDAGNETTVNQDDSTWGAQLRLQSYESVKPVDVTGIRFAWQDGDYLLDWMQGYNAAWGAGYCADWEGC